MLSCLQKEESDENSGSDDAGTGIATKENDQGIGSACACEGDLCTIAGMPTFSRGTITGCDDVPKNWPGAVLGCMQTSVDELNLGQEEFRFPQGFCTLMSVGCEGDDIVCNPSAVGDFEAMTSCPEGTVMITMGRDYSMAGTQSTVTYKLCSPSCKDDADCRVDDYDDVADEPGQYHCMDTHDVKFCYDARHTLLEGYTAEAF